MDKFHKGNLENWHKHEVEGGYIICGRFDGHPDFHWERGHTSMVLSFRERPRTKSEDTSLDDRLIDIETMNSRYTLVGDPADGVEL